MNLYHTDLSRYTSEGFGTLFTDAAEQLSPGDTIAVTDEDADTLAAEVLEVHPDRAVIRVLWDKVLHEA